MFRLIHLHTFSKWDPGRINTDKKTSLHTLLCTPDTINKNNFLQLQICCLSLWCAKSQISNTTRYIRKALYAPTWQMGFFCNTCDSRKVLITIRMTTMMEQSACSNTYSFPHSLFVWPFSSLRWHITLKLISPSQQNKNTKPFQLQF